MNRIDLDRTIELINEALAPAGYECLDVEWAGNDRALRVFIDAPSGIKMEDCVKANHLLVELEALDELIAGAYNLEVSSPGVERPLRSRDHFQSHVGQTIRVKLVEKVGDRKQGVGQIKAVSEDGEVTLDTAEGPWVFPLSRLKKANVVYDWDQA